MTRLRDEGVVISVAHILVSGPDLPQLIAVKNTTMMCCWTFFSSEYRVAAINPEF
jgi:hypothetical protein